MEEEMKGLREKALRAYKEHLEQRELAWRAKAQSFAEVVEKDFRERFETEPEKVSAVSPYLCFLESDGLKFKVINDRCKMRFFVLLECERCHRIFERMITSLRSLGEALSETRICEECEKCSKGIKEEQSTEEKIVKKLCEVLEMLRDYGSGCDYDYD